MLIYKCRERERDREREHSRERERERERQRERDRDGDRDRDRDRGREYRREARESSGAVNDSTSMRPKDVCLFLSIYYLAKLCTVSSMVNLWAAASAVERSAPPDRKKNAFSTVSTEQEKQPVAFVNSTIGRCSCLIPARPMCSAARGCSKQQLLVRVVLPFRRLLLVSFPLPSCARCGFGLQDGINICGRNISVYIYFHLFCFSLVFVYFWLVFPFLLLFCFLKKRKAFFYYLLSST
jgi:hypothetical protein